MVGDTLLREVKNVPRQKRYKTKYPGIFAVEGTDILGKPDTIFYLRYKKGGKLVEEKAGRASHAMTAAKANQLRAAKVEGKEQTNEERREAIARKKWTIAKLWEAYKASKPDLKGIVSDENRFKNYLIKYFGEKEPQEISHLDVDRLRLRTLKGKELGTVRNVLELLRRIVNYGVKKNLCPGLGFHLELPSANNEKTEDLNPEELTRLLDAIRDDPNIQAANFMLMVLYTGMRRGELFRLEWRDIDTERGFIRLRDPKGGKDQTIPLNDAARRLLDSHPRTSSPFVFPGRGGAMRVDINKQVNRVKDRAGLPEDFRPLHGLRHVYASMLASSGQVDMYTLQKLLTHKSPIMTQRYAHLRDDSLRKAGDLAGALIEQHDGHREQPAAKVVHFKRR